MKAVCWYGKQDIRVQDVPDPIVINPHDAIIKVTSTAICGSDLHIYNGFIPAMESGDILGHEFMGTVLQLGPKVRNLRIGDRVVVPSTISCGQCFYCQHEDYANCENTNPQADLAEETWGFSPAGVFGTSHLLGGYAGGQAEFVRVPFAGVGVLKVPEELSDEQVLSLSDNLPAGYMAAENADIQPGDIVAVWGCGPLGQLAIQSAFLLGAERVIAIDCVPERLKMAKEHSRAETIDFTKEDVIDTLKRMTGGRGPDACIDAVGMQARVTGLAGLYDQAKQAVRLESDRPYVLQEAILACRKGGRLSLVGDYFGSIDNLPIGAAFNKGLTVKMGHASVQKYMRPLLERIRKGELNPSFIVTHTFQLDQAPHAYQIYDQKKDGAVKVVLKP